MKSFIYIVYSDFAYMIGKSSDVYRRFAFIDSISPIDIKLLKVYRIPKNRLHEKRLHKKYSHKQIRKGWFALNDNNITEIESYLVENEGERILNNTRELETTSFITTGNKQSISRELDLDRLEESVALLKKTIEKQQLEQSDSLKNVLLIWSGLIY